MINLLPPEEKEALAKEQKRKIIYILSLEIIFFLLFILLILLALIFYFLGEIISQKAILGVYEKQLNSPQFLETKNLIKVYNKKLARASSFFQKRVFINEVIDILLKVERPKDLYFSNLLFKQSPDQKTTSVEINGVSKTREELLTFKSNLEKIKRIKKISFSPESWLNPINVKFKIILEIQNEEQN